jgi:hypothetical protein
MAMLLLPLLGEGDEEWNEHLTVAPSCFAISS